MTLRWSQNSPTMTPVPGFPVGRLIGQREHGDPESVYRKRVSQDRQLAQLKTANGCGCGARRPTDLAVDGRARRSSSLFFRPGVEGRRLFRRNDNGKVDALIDRRNNEDVVWKNCDAACLIAETDLPRISYDSLSISEERWMATAAPNLAQSRNRHTRVRWYSTGVGMVALVVTARLLLHLLTANRYGIFRDETVLHRLQPASGLGLCGHAAIHPRGNLAVYGAVRTSLFVIRLIPAIAGCGAIALTGYQAYQFGGKRYAMGLAALAMAVSPVFVINGHLLGTNDFEPVIWMGCASIVIRIIQTGNQKLWLWFGVLAGIGMQNKYSMAVFGLGIVVGLLLTTGTQGVRA